MVVVFAFTLMYFWRSVDVNVAVYKLRVINDTDVLTPHVECQL